MVKINDFEIPQDILDKFIKECQEDSEGGECWEEWNCPLLKDKTYNCIKCGGFKEGIEEYILNYLGEEDRILTGDEFKLYLELMRDIGYEILAQKDNVVINGRNSSIVVVDFGSGGYPSIFIIKEDFKE